jgi:hypothetical protein
MDAVHDVIDLFRGRIGFEDNDHGRSFLESPARSGSMKTAVVGKTAAMNRRPGNERDIMAVWGPTDNCTGKAQPSSHHGIVRLKFRKAQNSP